jgi:hypothetical protein
MHLIIPYYYKKKMKIKNIYIMETKGPFLKIMLLNEDVKHLFFKPNFDIGNFFDSFYIFQYPYYSLSTIFYDSHAIKVAP